MSIHSHIRHKERERESGIWRGFAKVQGAAAAMAMAFRGIIISNPNTFPANSIAMTCRFPRYPPLSLPPAAASAGVEREHDGAEAFLSSQLKIDQEKGSIADSSEVTKLFNDVQQNMLYLNKQRLTAVEELQKLKRENELLLARIGLLEAEGQASAVECEVLQHQLKVFKSKFGEDNGKRNKAGQNNLKVSLEPVSIFSELLLRIDSMVLTGAISAGMAGSFRSLVMNQDAEAAKFFSCVQTEDDKVLASNLVPLLDPNRRRGLHIVHICTELDPIANSGDLGSYVMGLSCALRRKGNLVEVVLPKYVTINMDYVQNLREIQVEFNSFFGGHWHKNKIWTGVVCGIAVTFIEPLHPGGFFYRDRMYDYNDDFERFTYFSRASLEYIVKSGKQPDILHLHNWHTAVVAPLFWDIFVGQGLGSTRLLFTCQDFKYQCLQEPAKLALCGLDPHQLHRPDRMQDNLDPSLVNVLKGGVVYSNKVTTVSPVYALDAMTGEHGHGLESTLITHKNKILGIYNGVDTALWDPKSDPSLPSVYSFENLAGKALCKSRLKLQLGLKMSDDTTPLVGCLVPQVAESELELVKAALACARMNGSQFVFMGESDIPRVQLIIEDLQREFEEKGGRAILKFDRSMVHLVLAGTDILICPSVSEGVSQMPLIAMQYGSIPVVKQQDGCSGSVIDADDISHWSEATGFIFRSATGSDVMTALSRAIACMTKDPKRWMQLLQNGMSKDFSWDAGCVEDYMTAYWSIKQL